MKKHSILQPSSIIFSKRSRNFFHFSFQSDGSLLSTGLYHGRTLLPCSITNFVPMATFVPSSHKLGLAISISSMLPPLRLRRFGQTLCAQRRAEMQLGDFRQFARAAFFHKFFRRRVHLNAPIPPRSLHSQNFLPAVDQALPD